MDKYNLNLKKYIGTKVVEARPMNEIDAESIGYARKNSDNHEWRNGYHVRYTNPDGSFYDSWSPKNVFEKAYHEVKGMNFGEVIEALKTGLAVKRKSWSGGKFLYYVPSASYPAMTDVAKSIMNEERKVSYKEYIAIRCKDGDVGFYTPTQCDVLANDWELVTE